MANAVALIINKYDGLVAFAGADDDLPDGYILANGATVNGNTTYPELGSLIGTRYGGTSRAALTLPSQIPSTLISGLPTVYPGTEKDYAEILTNSGSITATTEGTATAVITGAAVAYDGATTVIVQVRLVQIDASTALTATAVLYGGVGGTTVIGQVPQGFSGGSLDDKTLAFDYRYTPAAATITHKLGMFVSTGNVVVKAGAGTGTGTLLPSFMRVITV